MGKFINIEMVGPHGKSICSCGHVGDVGSGFIASLMTQPNQHTGTIGHGPCTVEGCDCEKFTWQRHLTAQDR